MFGSCLEDPLPLVIIDALQIVNYVTYPIQFQVGAKMFYIYTMKKHIKKFLH